MTKKITIESIEIAGFRAYLKSRSFNLRRGSTALSLAVFAPNAKGKSSIVDAFEFYFSPNATLERLGVKAADRNAGRAALEHVNAKTNGISSSVGFKFRDGTDTFGDSRPVVQAGAALTDAAQRVLAQRNVDFVIRGYELRAFVEQQTPERRYDEIVKWFGLQPLLAIQKNLRALRKQLKQKADSTADRDERLRDLKRITTNGQSAWDESSVCGWFSKNVLSSLDPALSLDALAATEAGYAELVSRKAAEDDQLGLTSLKRLRSQTDAAYKESDTGEGEPTGAIATFESAVATYQAAAAKATEEKARASDAVFADVWAAAKDVIGNEEFPLDACIVCETPFSGSPHGSRQGVRVRLESALAALAGYRDAEKGLAHATKTLQRARQAAEEALSSVLAGTKDTVLSPGTESVAAYSSLLAKWQVGEAAPAGAEACAALKALATRIEEEIKRIEEQKGANTYANALKIVDELIRLKADFARIDRTRAELARLHDALNSQAAAVNKAIVDHTQKLVGGLMTSINDLYRDIQGGDEDVPPIRLELPDEEDKNQQRVDLLIDFSDNRKGVVPSGYLSDSQLHALALSLRLTAIRMFNQRLPLIVLDDIVTSYDADHRKNIAAMLAKHFTDYQIVVVTHDERFFLLLQDHLPTGAWSYRRITEVVPDEGPAFHDHRTPDDVIEAKLRAGERAGNEIRQAEEEWLLDVCRAFRVKTVIRPVDRPYKYERGELANALASFLKACGITVPLVPGIANPFAQSLQKGDLENFASHFSDNPNESASAGDEKRRWQEFKYFRDLFACPACGCRRFKRPDSFTKPSCYKCETPFAFKEPVAPNPSDQGQG